MSFTTSPNDLAKAMSDRDNPGKTNELIPAWMFYGQLARMAVDPEFAEKLMAKAKKFAATFSLKEMRK